MLVWRLRQPWRVAASSPLGGGIGERRWIVNAQVPDGYARIDIEQHLEEIARELRCEGDGVGFLTAAKVEQASASVDAGIHVCATVGLRYPTWAASNDAVEAPSVGTVNIVAFVPARLSDAALVNAVMTVTEAKTQALFDESVPGTGTASDAVCILARADGVAEPFAGPRSAVGAALARATHAAVAAGARAWRASPGGAP